MLAAAFTAPVDGRRASSATSSGAGHARMRRAVHELGGRRDHARADARAEVALHALGHRGGAPVGSKRSRSRPSSRARSHRCGSSRCALVLEQRVVHLPEAALQRRRLGGAGQHPRARVLRGHREVPEHPPHRQRLQDQVRPRAVRALEVRVLEHHRRRCRGRGRPGPGSGGALLVQRVKDQVRARDLERRGRHVRPA